MNLSLEELILQVKPKSRNILNKTIILIGDSRSGKTTLSETLRNGITKVDHLQLYSETREPKINSVVIDHNNKKN